MQKQDNNVKSVFTFILPPESGPKSAIFSPSGTALNILDGQSPETETNGRVTQHKGGLWSYEQASNKEVRLVT